MPCAPDRRPGYQSSGFTLLELLLSLTLVSLLGLAAFSALHLCLKGAGRYQNAAENAQQLRLGPWFLYRSLSSLLPRMQLSGPWPYFVGESQEIRFLTAVPLAAHNLGGLYHWRVRVEPGARGRGNLVIEEGKALNWRLHPEQVEIKQVLWSDLASLRFTYIVGPEEYATWDAKRQGRLPDKVRMAVSTDNLHNMEWLIPLYVQEKGKTSL